MQTVTTLHPDIKADMEKMGRRAVKVIDPSPGLWGGDPIPGLVTVVYECPDGDLAPCSYDSGDHTTHTHHALYGPRDEKSTESGYTIYAD
jgi:hypothetical protein